MANIHPTAIVDPGAEIAADVSIGPFCVLDEHVRIDSGCRLFHHVYLTGWTHIGANCVIHPGAIVGHEPQDRSYTGERSYCRIGAGTVIREYATIHRGTTPDSETMVGRDCFLLGGAHIAHNCTLGDRVTIINDVLLAGHVHVGDDVTVGGGAAVHQFVRLGRGVMVAGNARVLQDVIPYAVANQQGRISGVNQVGLKRRGVPAEQVHGLRRVIRTLFATGGTLESRLEQVAGDAANPLIADVLAFARAESTRGLAGRHRSGR